MPDSAAQVRCDGRRMCFHGEEWSHEQETGAQDAFDCSKVDLRRRDGWSDKSCDCGLTTRAGTSPLHALYTR
jgi:hypothetical protein